jgi:hypothetical protein
MNIYLSNGLSEYFFDPSKLKGGPSLIKHPYIRQKTKELEIEYGRKLIISLQTIYQNPENPLNCEMWEETPEEGDHNCIEKDIFGESIVEDEDDCEYESPGIILDDNMNLIEITRSLWCQQSRTLQLYAQRTYNKMDSSMKEKLINDLERIHPELWKSLKF